MRALVTRVFLILLSFTQFLRLSSAVTAGDAKAQNRESLRRARVTMVEEPEATVTFNAQPGKMQPMIQRGLTHVTGTATLKAAWLSLISTQDTVGVKVFSAPGPTSGTRPAVVDAVVRSLLAAGLPPKQIVVWDKHLSDLRQAGFFELAERYGIRVAGAAEAGYDQQAQAYESALLGQLVWGDLEFGKKGEGIGRKSFVSKLVSREITKIINITPLLNHNLAGGNAHEQTLPNNDWKFWVDDVTTSVSRNGEGWGLARTELPVIRLESSDEFDPALIRETHRRRRNFIASLTLQLCARFWKQASAAANWLQKKSGH